MTDITPTIQPNVDQLTADILRGRTITIDIIGVDVNLNNKDKQYVTIHYQGEDGHPYKPSLGMRCVIAGVWGNDSKQYVGRSMTLYCDPEVFFGKDKTGGVRISQMSHIDEARTVIIRKARGKRIPWTVHPIVKTTVAPVVVATAATPDQKSAAAETAKLGILTAINTAKTNEELTAFIATKAETIKRLQDGYADKYTEIMVALADKQAALEPKPEEIF